MSPILSVIGIVIIGKKILRNVIKSIVVVSCYIVTVVVGQVAKASTPKSLRFCRAKSPVQMRLKPRKFLLKMH